ncbi:MAG TPA: hypothetical protein VGC62_09240 [Pseudomonas sp.]|uniref:hypothetical protein n=1 Tax=Pseudomonas sp. TaxID=306 RepID=UPI002ED7CA32
MNALNLDRFKREAQANHDAAYFVGALAKLIDTVGSDDPCLCAKALDGYVVGGLVAGLRIVSGEMMVRNEGIITLIEAQDSAPQNSNLPNRGAELEVSQ